MMTSADVYMDGYFVGLLVGYLGVCGLTPEEAESEIALGPQSMYKRVRDVASDPLDAARWSVQARNYRLHGEP